MCLFSMINLFYPYQNWGISTEDAISFNLISKGNKILIEEFPSSEDFIDTKEKINSYVKATIAREIYGDEGFYRSIQKDDAMLQKVLELDSSTE